MRKPIDIAVARAPRGDVIAGGFLSQLQHPPPLRGLSRPGARALLSRPFAAAERRWPLPRLLRHVPTAVFLDGPRVLMAAVRDPRREPR
jgi:hypothetical protein